MIAKMIYELRDRMAIKAITDPQKNEYGVRVLTEFIESGGSDNIAIEQTEKHLRSRRLQRVADVLERRRPTKD